MHKKLAADLTSLAHSILQMKNKEDVLSLKQMAHEVYEKLAVLAYVDEYINTTPNATESKEEILEKISQETIDEEMECELDEILEELFEEESEDELVVEFVAEENEEHVVIAFEDDEEKSVNEPEDKVVGEEVQAEEEDKKEPVLNVVEEIVEQPFDELEQTLFSSDDFVKEDNKTVEDKKVVTLEEELEDTISVDVAADLFEKSTEKKSLNDTLQSNIQIGLNDRIAFVKNLFEGNQGDFNRVVSQLNTFKTEKEAKKFINKMVKPDYNWANQEEYEERFMSIIERKFA